MNGYGPFGGKRRELRRHVVHYQAIMDALHEGVVFLDGEGQILACNPSAERILGLSRAQLTGKASVDPKLFAAVHENGRPFLDEEHPSQVTLRTGRPCFEVVQGISNGHGTSTWICINAQPVRRPGAEKLKGVVVSFWDITRSKHLEDNLRSLATRDELTGLSNRRHLMEHLTLATHAASRHGHSLCLCLCDLDHFKAINDTYGHPAGDRAIQSFAYAIAGELREEDVAARIGGDEFGILFSHTSIEGAKACVERIRVRVDELTLGAKDTGTAFRIQASFGLAAFQKGLEVDRFLDLADQALYEAKRSGRNATVVKA